MGEAQRRIVFATRNRGKLIELQQLMRPLRVEIVSISNHDNIPDVEETGATFAANAELKARAASEAIGLPAIADDSGLEVDALGGRPGLFSARYAGEGASDHDRNNKLLAELAGVPDAERTARYRCTIAYVDAGAEPLIFEASCEGRILRDPLGKGGFGYDPLFFSFDLGMSMAEADEAAKNRISHRGKAMQQLVDALTSLFGASILKSGPSGV